MLRGRFSAEQDKMVTCPAIKNNCCTKLDQQRIYHTVNDILPQRVIEYQAKVRSALSKLKKLHQKVLKNKTTFTGRPRRRIYCGIQARKVYNFPFLPFYDKVIEDLESVRPNMDDYYRTFFCNICDGDNHPFIALKTKKLVIDAEFCQSFLKEHEEIIQMLNIELVEYLVSLQNVVDCNHYLRSYNLKFYEPRKVEFMKELGQCINNIASKKFVALCKTTCENILLSKINVLFEGDFEFLMDAVNLFEKFFELKENGNFISMRLRLFFKKFVIPRKLSAHKKARFLTELRKREAETAHRRLRQINRKLAKNKEAAITGEPIDVNSQMVRPQRKSKNVKMNRNFGGPAERNLIEVVPASIEVSKTKANVTIPKLEKGRVLQSANQQNNQQQNNNQQNNQQGNQQNGQGNFRNNKKIKRAQLIYNKELFNFYSEIKVIVPTEKKYVFRVRPRPIDIEHLKKTFIMNEGINPGKFLGNMKFDLPPGIFYKMLFSYRKPDQADPNLMFFLTDFTPVAMEELKKDLKERFTIEAAKKKKKKNKVKKGRILSILTRSEKSLNENFLKKSILKDIDLLKPNN